MIDKHISINKLIYTISEHIVIKELKLVDYWDADLCAFGIEKGNFLVYISSYNYLNYTDSRFDYTIESINDTGGEISYFSEGECVSEKDIIDIIVEL